MILKFLNLVLRLGFQKMTLNLIDDFSQVRFYQKKSPGNEIFCNKL